MGETKKEVGWLELFAYSTIIWQAESAVVAVTIPEGRA